MLLCARYNAPNALAAPFDAGARSNASSWRVPDSVLIQIGAQFDFEHWLVRRKEIR